jgi:hypothetical protein
MEISENVILDLLPLYFAKEASTDSVKIVETYLKENPEFASRLESNTLALDSVEIKTTIMEEEMAVLQKTKRLVRIRSMVMGFAIFFTAVPFSFGDVSWDNYDGVLWLWADNPFFAFLIGTIGLGLWVWYYYLNKRLSV